MSQDDQLSIEGLISEESKEPLETAPASDAVDVQDEASQVGGGEAAEPAHVLSERAGERAKLTDPPAESTADEVAQVVDVPSRETALAAPLEEPEAPAEQDGAANVDAQPAPVVDKEEAVPPARPAALYFLTNRMNLNGVLSSRVVAPRESHAKYYVDLLQQVPGWVPLLTQPPTQALIEAVSMERGAGGPVLIEFPVDVVERALNEPVAYVPAVALSKAVAIHFREERDLREHRARGYKNVHPHDDLLKVTPELFASEGFGDAPLASPPMTHSVSWRRLDRIRGAVSAVVASVETGEQLAVAAAFLGEVKFPAALSLPGWLSWREIDDHDDAGGRLEPDVAVPDHVGFRAVYDVLGEQDAADAWSPNSVLDAVAARVQAAGLTDDAADAIIRNLQRVRAIVNVEADFEPFRPTPRALVSAKALLLVLLRPELEDLLAWTETETGADDVTRGAAALLAGRLRGLARETTALRSLALDDMTAAWAVRIAQGAGGTLGKVQFASNSRGTTLRLDGVELAVRDALLPDLAAKYRKMAEGKKEAARIKVSRAMGWPVEHRIEVPEGAAVTPGKSFISISTPNEVTMSLSVDEEKFIQQLSVLSGASRRKAAEAFAMRR